MCPRQPCLSLCLRIQTLHESVPFRFITRQERSSSRPTSNPTHCLMHVTRDLVANWRGWLHTESQHCARTQRPHPTNFDVEFNVRLSWKCTKSLRVKKVSLDSRNISDPTRTTPHNAWCVYNPCVSFALLHCFRHSVAPNVRMLCQRCKVHNLNQKPC